MVAHLANLIRARSLAARATIAEADEAAKKTRDASRDGINPASMQARGALRNKNNKQRHQHTTCSIAADRENH
jgi:hypothetical protein